MEKNENLTNQVYQKLKAQIINNEIAPNSYLDEKALCQSLGVSRTPVREALARLERDGLVEAYQQEAPTGRMRKYYHLTRKGGAALRSEAEAWRAYSGAVNAVLRSSPGLNLA